MGLLNRSERAGEPRRQKVLAVASGGGHWIQLLRMMPAFAECEVSYVTTLASYRPEVEGARFHVVKDANRWDKLGLLKLAVQVAWIIRSEKPDVIISTGAAPGYFALRLGRLFGIRTVWVDSIANVDGLSLAGEKVGRYAELWLTQWPHLARPEGPFYTGAVL